MWPTAEPAPPTESVCAEAASAGVMSAALAERSEGQVARLSDAAWSVHLRDTCAWIGGLAAEVDRTCMTAVCVRRVTEARLAAVVSTAPAARAADLRTTTGRECGPTDRRGCAPDAAAAEDERLARLMAALDDAGWAAGDAERSWFVYRDGACAAEAVGAGPDADWSRAACAAVLAARQTELVADLVRTARPELGAILDRERYDLALRGVRPRVPWEAWAREVGPSTLDALREAAEARADGAWLPPLLAEARGCATLDETCWAEVRARGPISEVPWREAWCGRMFGPRRAACDAEVDWIAGHEGTADE